MRTFPAPASNAEQAAARPATPVQTTMTSQSFTSEAKAGMPERSIEARRFLLDSINDPYLLLHSAYEGPL